MEIPEAYRNDLDAAVAALKKAGSTEIYLFGSIAEGLVGENSDIDLAVRGIPAEKFFKVYSDTARRLDHDLDLVDLDHETDFAAFLRETNRLVKIS